MNYSCKYKILLTCIFYAVILFTGCGRGELSQNRAERGVADLRDGRVNSIVTELNGEWEFYPGRLLLPADFINHREGSFVYQKVPGDWNRVQAAKGIGTYRLKVLLPDNYINYSMKAMWIKSAAEIWIDNNILLKQGTVDSSEENSTQGDYISIADFVPSGNQFNITIQVANYFDRRGGLCFPVSLAPPVIMYHNEMEITFFSALVIGAMLIVILFHSALHYYFSRLSINLYISLVCLMVMMRFFILTDSSYIYSVIKPAGVSLLVKIEFISLILIFVFLMQFFMKLYLPSSKSRIKRILYWTGVISIIYVAAAQLYYIKTALPFFQAYIFIVAVFILTCPIITAVKRGIAGARIYFVSIFLALLAMINDISYFLTSRGLPNISGYLFVLFLVGHFVVVSIYFSDVFHKNLSLVEELGLKKTIVTNLSFLSTTDSLTEIYNRRFFDSYLIGKIRDYTKGENVWLVIFDIDFFKKINDDFGHTKGDVVLKELSRLVRGLIRTGDILCRWGGEEFAVVISGMDENGIRHFTERIRESIEEHSFSVERKITASFGVALYRYGESSESFLNRTDRALYSAKNNGRNLVVFAELQQ